MKFKVWLKNEEQMYWNAHLLTQGEWNFARLFNNKHAICLESINKQDRNGVDLYVSDIVRLDGYLFYVTENLGGSYMLKNDHEELYIHDLYSGEIEVLGSMYELEGLM